MTVQVKIDSNVTGLRIAEEESLKTLPVTPIWYPYEPNSYKDFGGQVTTVAREPIAADRQRKKGVLTDLDASGGFNNDLTQTNLQNLLQGVFFADLRTKGEEAVTAVTLDTTNPDEYMVASTTGFLVNSIIQGSGFTNAGNNTRNVVTVVTTNTAVKVADGTLTAEASPPADAKIVAIGYQFASATLNVDVSGAFPKLLRASGAVDFTTLGLIPGEWIFVGGDSGTNQFVNDENNGFKRVRSVATTYIELDKSDSAMTSETGTGLLINVYFGRVLKNETGSLIKRRTYQLERQLGAPDSASPSQIQSEYLIGSVANEAVFNIKTADKINVDLTFLSCDSETRSGATGVKSGTRPDIVEADAFNTSSDFSRIRLAAVDSTLEAPTPLFAFVTDMTLTINNNASTNKAIGTLGAFDVTAGTFQVSGSMTAYFADVAAISTVRANASVTLDMAIVKNNAGIVIDVPLITLSDARAKIEKDQPITLPITQDAASGSAVLSTMNHTLMMTFFDYLPNLAG